jgi:hypothetical protein
VKISVRESQLTTEKNQECFYFLNKKNATLKLYYIILKKWEKKIPKFSGNMLKERTLLLKEYEDNDPDEPITNKELREYYYDNYHECLFFSYIVERFKIVPEDK